MPNLAEKLPRSRACLNQLTLTTYANAAELRVALFRSMELSEGQGMEDR